MFTSNITRYFLQLFRLCRYFPGGHFAPHFDGHYDKTPSERSLKTLMVYLNGDFTGGSTSFVDEQQTLYKVIYSCHHICLSLSLFFSVCHDLVVVAYVALCVQERC